ncbi:MAG: hypothetical protein Dasosvirus24_1, partial [Dasosvirus sp.]
PVNTNKLLLDKCSIFNMIMTTCKHYVPLYKLHNKNKYIQFTPIGYDTQLFRVYSDKEIEAFDKSYKCDISFICDALYNESKDQIIPRKELINQLSDIAKEMNLKFNLYGPDLLQAYFPDNYKGDIAYIDMPALFTMSKINIVSHVFSKKKISVHHNIMPILASGSILLTDDINGACDFYNKKNPSVFLYKRHNLKKMVLSILQLYKTNVIKEIKKNASDFSKKYSWEKFVDKIFVTYNNDRFDHLFYIKTYTLDTLFSDSDTKNIREKCYEYWYNRWKNNIFDISYRINVPINFDYKAYKEVKNVKSNVLEYIYIHWFQNGSNQDYMKRTIKNQNNLVGADMNICTTKLFDLFRGFNQISMYGKHIDGIKEIDKIAKSNPRLKINMALDHYLDLQIN